MFYCAVRLNSILTGDPEVLSADEPKDFVPVNFSLKQNYPNPFNPLTNIEFEIEKDAKVVLTIYNALGQKLFNIVNGQMEAGTHTIQFDASSLASGVYFYELTTNGNSKVLKMTLIR